MTGTDIIYVYAHWTGMKEPQYIGALTATFARSRRAYSFEYAPDWIASNAQVLLDPEIQWYSGKQHPNKENFGVFMDSMPDTWGRRLMRRRAAIEAQEKGEHLKNLHDIDFLLGVHDFTRMGALRFKKEKDGPFLDNNNRLPAPPWTNIRELQYSAIKFDEDSGNDKEWLEQLIAPGSSLGGARPKANIIDEQNNLWIAKFPAKSDSIDKGSWEYLAYQLAISAGITMSDSRLEKVYGPHNTFFTKRFDRKGIERIHFASAMTMTGRDEELNKTNPASYLDIAEFIQINGSNIQQDLEQLWRRIIFNISISNTDDHFRNHGFILDNNGWRLSPAYDINPSIEKNGLAINIDLENNSQDYKLAKSVGVFFQLDEKRMDSIINEVKESVSKWKTIAKDIGIPRSEQELMAGAFLV